MPYKREGKETDEQVINEALRRFRICEDVEHEPREKSLEDLRFLCGEQWTDRALAQRTRDQRPALVVNRVDQFALQVSNAMRQNRVSARVYPVDDKADVDTAEVIQGIVRNVENESKALLAYHTAGFYAVAGGFGYFRQVTKYADPLSFDLDIRIERLPNPFQVYLGHHTMPDGSDTDHGFIFTDLSREAYTAEYPKSKAAKMKEWSAEAVSVDVGDGWVEEDQIRVCEYYCTKYEHDTLVRLADGSAALKSKLQEGQYQPMLDENGQLVERETTIPTVVWYKFNAFEVLDETVWPIPRVPIYKVSGHELTIDNKRVLKGIVRNLKDAQRQYNYMLSAQTEAIDASKGPVVVADGQEEGHEEELRNLNRQTVVRYKPTTVDGLAVPPPTRLPPNLSVQAMTEARMLAADDLKALTGIYDAALGARSNETSGKGILARQQQSDTANFHYQDNLTLAISTSCRDLVDMIGKIYDTPRVARTIGDDDAQRVVMVNQPFQQDGEWKFYNLKVGRYDVVCSAGPNFETKRQQGAAELPQILQAIPIIGQVAPDLVVKMLNWPYSQEFADRVVRALPPHLIDKPGQAKIPPAAARQIQEQGQLIEQLSKELQARTQQMETKQFELQSKERIEAAKIDSNEAIAALKAQIDMLKIQIDGLKTQIGASLQVMSQGARESAQTM